MASPSSISDDSEEESIISYYFLRGYTYEVIRGFLATFHSITTCGRQGGLMISALGQNGATYANINELVRQAIQA